MKELHRHEVVICGDCIIFNAYGEGEDAASTGHADRVRRQWPDAGAAWWEIVDVRADDGDSLEPYFSKAPCDECGETLAGHRWDAVAMLWVAETDWDAALASFVEGYDECARWGGVWDADGELEEDAYGYDWDVAASWEIVGDCADFLAAQWDDMVKAWQRATGSTVDVDWERMGHDFYLTRCGHGTGFWDRDYGPAGDRLSDASKVYGDVTYMLHEDRLYA